MDGPGRRSAPPEVVSAALAGAILAPLLLGYEPVGGDPDRIYRPIKAALGLGLADGTSSWPALWSDRFGVGVPLAAESHSGVFYPPNLAFYALGVSWGYRLSMWAHHLALAGLTCAYARRLGCTPAGGVLAGVAFAFCGMQAIHSSHEWMYQALPYLPLALLLGDLYAETGRLRWAAGLALALGVQWTAGHFQIQVWTNALVLGLGAWKALRSTGGRVWLRVPGLAGAILWGAAIAAVQLGPSWELARAVGQDRRPVADRMFYAFPPSHGVELAIPRLFRGPGLGPEDPYWFSLQTTGFEACLAVGTIPLILACLGLVARRPGLGPWKVLTPAFFALATMPRWWPPGYEAFLALPGLGYFRCPARFNILTSLGLALLAGGGFDRAIPPGRRWAGLALAVAVGASAFGWAAWWKGQPGTPSGIASAPALEVFGPPALSWAVGLALVVSWSRGRVGSWAPILAAAVELGLIYYSMTTRWGPSIDLPGSSPMLSALAREPGSPRVVGPVDNLPARAPNAAAGSPYLGFPMPPPHPILKAAGDPRALVDPAARRWLRRLGMTHALVEGPVEAPGARIVARGSDPALDVLAYPPPGARRPAVWSLLALPGAFPPARVVPDWEVAPDERTLLDRLSREDAPDLSLFLPGDAPRDLPRDGPRSRSARVLDWDGHSGRVEHDGTGLLVLTRMAYPGWTYRLDGGPEHPVLRADGGLQAIPLEGSGTTRVSVRYRPSGFGGLVGLSAVGTLSALAVLLGAALRPVIRRGARPSVEGPGG